MFNFSGDRWFRGKSIASGQRLSPRFNALLIPGPELKMRRLEYSNAGLKKPWGLELCGAGKFGSTAIVAGGGRKNRNCPPIYQRILGDEGAAGRSFLVAHLVANGGRSSFTEQERKKPKMTLSDKGRFTKVGRAKCGCRDGAGKRNHGIAAGKMRGKVSHFCTTKAARGMGNWVCDSSNETVSSPTVACWEIDYQGCAGGGRTAVSMR